MDNKISAVITCVNGEEKYLPLCLTSLKKFVNEIVIVDMSDGKDISTIGKKFDAKIYRHEFVNYVEPVRNFGISKATGEWIVILDPDEELRESLVERFEEIIKNNEADYVRIPRENIVFGKALKHSRWWPDYNIRFFRKGKVSWDEVIHSVPMTEGNGIDLDAEEKYAIKHHHYETVEQFIERMNRYTTVQAKLKSKTQEFKWQDLIIKPTGEFLSRFFAGEGYKDGLHGLALSLLQSFSELIVYLKIWQLKGFKEETLNINDLVYEFEKSKKDFNYWQNDALIKVKGNLTPGTITLRVKRKLRL